MTVYDCFTYFNEVDILRMRFEELKDRVGYFVVVEADQTFTGKPKPFYFDHLPSWIDEWKPRVIRHKISFPSQDMTPWEREIYQRNQIVQAIPKPNWDDVIIISDADEIPRPDFIHKYESPMQLDVAQYFWNLNWRVPDHCNQGGRPVVTTFQDLTVTSAQELRSSNDIQRIPYGGWHFSFLGDGNQARNKIESFAHTEMDTEEFKSLDHIAKCSELGIDPFDRFPLKYEPIGLLHPIWVQLNQDALSHLIK